MACSLGCAQLWKGWTTGAFVLLLVLLSPAAQAQKITCPGGELRTRVAPGDLARKYEGWSMAGTLSSLSVLGAGQAARPEILPQAMLATQQWSEILKGLAARYNRCEMTREQYAEALDRVYPRLKEDAADLEKIRQLLAQGKSVDESHLGILLDSYSANLRRFIEISGQEILLERIAAVVDRKPAAGPGEDKEVLDELVALERSLKDTPLTAPESAETAIQKKLAGRAKKVAGAYSRGFNLFQRFRFQEAVPWFEQALAEAKLPELHAALGRTLLQLSQSDRAETVFREGLAVARRERQTAQEAELSFWLGRVLLEQGKLDLALAGARQALALQEEVYGTGDPKTAHFSALVGQILRRQGDLDGALEATRRALQISESTLGANHPDTARFLATLGTILESRGDLDGALEYQRRALSIFERSSEADSADAIQALANVGSIRYRKGNLKEAHRATQQALEKYEKLFGPDRPRVARCRRNLAMIHLKLGNLDAALQNTRRVLQTFERTLDPGDPEIAITASNLGLILQQRGDLDAALAAGRRALEIDEKAFGPDHPNVALRANYIAGMLREKGNLAGALAFARRALHIDEATFRADHYSIARDSHTLAQILLDRRDLKDALAAAQRALSIDEVAYDVHHYEVARDSATLASILLAQGDLDGALRSAQRALEIGRKTFGPDVPVVAQYARGVGLVLRKRGDLAGARSHFEEAHRVFEAKYGPDHPMTRKAAQDLEAGKRGFGLSRTALLAVAAVAITVIALVLLVLFLRERRTLAHTLARSESLSRQEPVGAPPPASSTSSSTGLSRIGPYRLEGRLGEGGMGVVYRAFDERLERWVAVKLIPPDKSWDPHRRERLRREAQASARLSHPAIIQVHDYVHTEQADGIVMELVEGELLTRLLWKGPLDLPRALQVARDIAEALEEAHSKGIIHRDLKTENVIVTPSGRAKILDFGIAKRLDRNDTALTTEGAVIGTYRAMAPEQAQGKEMDHRADLFALGTLFYEMFTGKSPFLGSSAADTMWRICCHRQSPAREANPRVPDEISELIDWLLQKEPQNRPRDAREIVAVLTRIAGSVSSSATATHLVPELEASTFCEAPGPAPEPT